MIWLFLLPAALAVFYLLQLIMSGHERSVVAGFWLVLLAMGMEFINQWAGPFWVAQESLYLIAAGLPVEKLLFYWIGASFACWVYANRSATSRSTRLMLVVTIAFLMTGIEWLMNQTEVFRWVRPWTALGAFAYYTTGAYLLFRFYDMAYRTKMMLFGAVLLLALLGGLLSDSIETPFPLAQVRHGNF